jgi:hypothetical protein
LFDIDILPAKGAHFTDFQTASVEEADEQTIPEGSGCLDEPGGFFWGDELGQSPWASRRPEPGGDGEAGEFVEDGPEHGDVAGEPRSGGAIPVDVMDEGFDNGFPDVAGPFGSEGGVRMLGGESPESAENAAIEPKGGVGKTGSPEFVLNGGPEVGPVELRTRDGDAGGEGSTADVGRRQHRRPGRPIGATVVIRVQRKRFGVHGSSFLAAVNAALPLTGPPERAHLSLGGRGLLVLVCVGPSVMIVLSIRQEELRRRR